MLSTILTFLVVLFSIYCAFRFFALQNGAPTKREKLTYFLNLIAIIVIGFLQGQTYGAYKTTCEYEQQKATRENYKQILSDSLEILKMKNEIKWTEK